MISARDVDDIYKVPLMFRAEGVDDLILDHFKIEAPAPELTDWEAIVRRAGDAQEQVRIALVGKYVQLEDAYLSVVEALKHAGFHHGAKIEVFWVDSESLDDEEGRELLQQADGILIPGGFGVRGIEGKINAARVARERKIPFLGICLGMQLAVVDFARHVVGMDGANSAEFDPETPFPVIDLLPEQKEVDDMGGTMRLGADPVKLHDSTRAREAYGEQVIYQRHRHRYEVNNLLRRRLEDARPGVQRHVPRRPPGRGRRAAGPPVLHGFAVPPRVQVAPEPPRAHVPGVRRPPRSSARASGARLHCTPRRSPGRSGPSGGAGEAGAGASPQAAERAERGNW